METLVALLFAIPLSAVILVLILFKHPKAMALVSLGASGGCLLTSAGLALRPGSSVAHPVGGWEAPYGIVLDADHLTLVMLLLNSVVFLAATLYQAGRELSGAEQERVVYHVTFPMLLLALNGLFLTMDFFNFYVFFELVAVTSYVLVATGKHHPLEASWKYAAQSVLGSAILLASIAFIYGHTGSLNMIDAAQRLGGPIDWVAPFILVALLLKGSLFPFHLWQPDAHAAASSPGSAVLAGILINIGIYGLLRFRPLLFSGAISPVLLAVGAASMVFGAGAAWKEADAKRLLGFSSTSQLGFVLMGIGWGTRASLSAAILFMIHHSLSKSLLFLSIGILTDSTGSTRLDRLTGQGSGLAWIRPAFLLGFISLVGLPPAMGFVGKLAILKAGIELGAWPWIAALLSGTIMTLAYAGRIYQNLFWHSRRKEEKAPEGIHFLVYCSIAFLSFLVIAGGLIGQPVWTFAERAADAAGWNP